MALRQTFDTWLDTTLSDLRLVPTLWNGGNFKFISVDSLNGSGYVKFLVQWEKH